MPVVIFIAAIAVLGMIGQAIEAIWAAWNWGILCIVVAIVGVGTVIAGAIIEGNKGNGSLKIQCDEWRNRALAAEANLEQQPTAKRKRATMDDGDDLLPEWMDRALNAEEMLETIEKHVLSATEAAEARMAAFEQRAEAADHQAAMIGERCIMLEQQLATERQANIEAKRQPVLAPEWTKFMLVHCHPYKHGNSKVATEVTQWLLTMRKKG
jgi:hypothetical protein